MQHDDIIDILTQPTDQPEPDPPYMAPEATPKIMSIENTAQLLEHSLVKTLLDIMETGNANSRLSAVDKTAEILGKKQKQAIVMTDAINMQQNNFIEHFKSQTKELPDAHPTDSSTPKSKFDPNSR